MGRSVGVSTESAVIRSLDESTRTAELLFSSGAVLRRFAPFSGHFELQFSFAHGACKLSRLKSGRMNLLDSHGESLETKDAKTRLDLVLGVVEDGWIEDECRGIARVRFARTYRAEERWRMLVDGVLCNVSQGSIVHAMREITERGALLRRFLATSWETTEISLVAVPADGGAGVFQPQ